MKIPAKKYLPFPVSWIFCLALCSPFVGWSQTEVGLWTGLNVEKNLNRTFAFRLNTEVRFSDNITVARTYLVEPGLTVKFNNHWKVTGYYRYIQRLKWDSENRDYNYTPYSRFYVNLSYDRSLWKLKLDYRMRYQHQFKDDPGGELVSDKSYLRNKLELSYKNDSHFTPFVSADLFYRMGSHFDEIRYKAGTEFKINKYHSIDLYGFTDQELDEHKSPKFILGVQYKLEF